MLRAVASHWPEYLIEACLLALFMISASAFGTLLEHPGSPVRGAIDDPFLRRVLMGCAMGATAIALIYSPLGKRSGAHINPAVTLSFATLGRVRPLDACLYVVSQFAGGVLGVWVASILLDSFLADPAVNYVVTVPGRLGEPAAFVAELAISFTLMTVVLWSSSIPSVERFTGILAGSMVALYITFEAPISGMSMNAARTFGSAVHADVWSGFWIYVTAPLLGMLSAAALFARTRLRSAGCAKLDHANSTRCIFCGANS